MLPKVRVHNLRNPKTLLSLLLQLSIVLLSVAYPLMYPKKSDANLTTGYIRFDRQSINQTLAGVVCIRSTQNTPGAAKVIVQFPSTVNFNSAGDTTWTDDVTATNLPSGATAWPVTGASLKMSSATTSAVFLVGDLASNANTYCFHFSGLAASSTTGTSNTAGSGQVIVYKTDAAGGGIVEQFAYGTQFVGTAGNGNEQVLITATVSAQLTFSLTGTGAGATATTAASMPLGVLSASSVTVSPYTVTATVTTNARNGYLTWIKGGNGSLHSDTTGDSIMSPGTYDGTPSDISGGTGGYGIFASGGGDTPTIPGEYNNITGGNNVGHIDNSQFYQLSSYASPTTGSTTTIGVKAKPATTTKAGTDYNDALTLVASGSF